MKIVKSFELANTGKFIAHIFDAYLQIDNIIGRRNLSLPLIKE